MTEAGLTLELGKLSFVVAMCEEGHRNEFHHKMQTLLKQLAFKFQFFFSYQLLSTPLLTFIVDCSS